MMRTKRTTAFLLALIMIFTSGIPSYAEEQTFIEQEQSYDTYLAPEDVSEDDFSIVATVSDNEEEKIPEESDVSAGENSHNEFTSHTPALDISGYIWQLGGLESAYEEEPEQGLDNRFDAAESMDLQGAYEAVTKAIAERQKTVNLGEYHILCDGTEEGEKELISVVSTAVNDNSMFGYFGGITQYTTNSEDIIEEIEFEYDDNSFDADVYENALNNVIEEAITDAGEADYIKAMELHNWLVQHVDYDMDLSNPNKYTGYGAVVDRECVCMGYAIAYGDLLTKVGIKHGYITSNQMDHMWNVVQIDGKWYHVDCTWDDPVDYTLGKGRFSYFLISTSNIEKKGHNYPDWVTRISDTYDYFSGFGSVSCTSTKYDEYWWQDVSSMIVYHDKYFYYQKDFYPKGYILKVKAPEGDALTVAETGYGGRYANVSASNGYLVYKDGNSISKLKFGETTPKTIYTPSSGNVFETLACGSKLYYMQGTDRGHAKKKSMSLFSIANASITATYKSLTYNTSKKSELTGSYTKYKSGTTTLQWYVMKPGETTYTEIPGATSKTYIVDPLNAPISGGTMNAGTYKFKFVATLGEDETSKTISITVNKAALSVKNKDYEMSREYNTLPMATPVTANFITNASYLSFAWYKSSTISDSTKLAEAPVNAGTYYLVATYGGDTNIKSGSVTFTVTVTKKDLNITIGNQSLLWDESISSDISDIAAISGLQGTDNVTGIVLKQSTKEPTDEGTISCSSIVIKNDNGEKVNANYDIHYALGKLTINKRNIVVTAKDLEISVGDPVFNELSGIESVTGDISSDRFVLTSVKFVTDITNVGTGSIRPDSVKIMRTGTSTDVTKYFNIGYVEGIFTISKKTVYTTADTAVFWHKTDEGQFEDTVNILKLAKLPSDAKSVSIEAVSPETIPESSNVKEVTEPSEGVVIIKGTSGISEESLTFEYKVTSDNYEDVTVNVICNIGKTPVTVVFHGEEGNFKNGEDEYEMTLCEGEPLPEDIAFRMWYDFAGWYTEAGVLQTIVSETNLYAHWTVKYKVFDITADVESGSEVKNGTRISLSTETVGAKIYYTTDGTIPDVTDNDLYKEAIEINENTTIKAIAVKQRLAEDGHYELYWAPSDLFEASYVVAEAGWGDVTAEDRLCFESITEVPSGLWYARVSDTVYNGKNKTQADMRVYYGTRLLVKDKDYTVSYTNNKNAGEASVKIKGKGNYRETASVKFTIHPLNLSTEVTVTASIEPIKASSTYKTPNPTVKFGTITLKKDADYTVTYKAEGSDTEVSKVKTAGNYKVIIKGKNNYVGNIETDLLITKSTLMSSTTVSGISSSYKYIGTYVRPGFKVLSGTKQLVGAEKGSDEANEPFVDYVFEFRSNIENGTASLVLEGTNNNTDKGTFCGTKTVTFKIKAYRSMADTTIVFDQKSYSCTGAAVIPGFTVKYKGESLGEDDYTYTITNNIKPGKIKVTCKGKGKYSGTKTFTVTLAAKSISKASVSSIVSSVVYTGAPVTQAATITLGDVTLTEGTDYTVTYKSNIKVGTATVTYTGINEYTGSIKKTFAITKYNLLTGADVAGLVNLSYDHVVAYQKGETKPSITLTFNGTQLKSGSDYTIKFDKNKAVGSASAKAVFTITGKGNFTGTLTGNFVITKADISDTDLSVKDLVYSPKGSFKSPVVMIDTNGAKLKSGTDYDKKILYTYAYDTYVTVAGKTIGRHSGEEVGAKDIVPAGSKINVTVKGKGNYYGTVSKSYYVVTQTLANAKISVKTQTYTGNPITLSKSQITVKVGGKALSSSDYDIVGYSNNTKAGTATVILEGKGNYSGTKTVKFKISARKLKWFN